MGKGQRRSNMGKDLMNTTLKVPFTELFSINRKTSAGYEITETDMLIANFASTSRIRALGGMYEYFRVSRLSVEAFSDSNGTAVFAPATSFLSGYSHAVAFIPSVIADYAAPTNYGDVLQYPDSAIGSSREHLRLNLGPKQLYACTPAKWYHTATTGTVPVADMSPGTVTYVTHTLWTQSASTTNSYVILRGIMEFKAPLYPGNAAKTLVVQEPRYTLSPPDTPFVLPDVEKVALGGRTSERRDELKDDSSSVGSLSKLSIRRRTTRDA